MNDNIDNKKIDYVESGVEKHNRIIAIRILVVGIIVSLVLCGVGLVKQNIAKKTNEERYEAACVKLQEKLDAMQARYDEIASILPELEEKYEAKLKERASYNMRDDDWYEKASKAQLEAANILSQINSLKSESSTIVNTNYKVYYDLVEPITYTVFYYIASGIFIVLSLIALIYFLVTRKK